MAITVNSVTAAEMWDSFRKGRGPNGPYVELGYLVPFAQADAFIDGCMGGFVSTGGPNGTIRNVPKLACPTNPKLYAMSADEQGVGERADASAGGRPVFSHSVVTVRFEVPTWPQFPADDPGGQQAFPNETLPGEPFVFADCEIDMGGESVTVPETSFVFASDSAPTETPVTVWVGNSTWRITRHYFPNLPHAKIASLLNGVNNDVFLGQPKGQIRFANARTKQIQTADGTRTQNLELIFEWREHDWNTYLRPNGYVWEKVVSKSDATVTPYVYRNLKPLLYP